MILILMGVSGSGKTTVGKLVASELHWDFVDADDYHPAENRNKMRAGVPLTDEDRTPWLQRLSDLIHGYQKQGKSLVLACSALRKTYREMLGVDQKTVRTFYLKGTKEEFVERLADRRHPFFDPHLLDSQIATLEEPAGGFTLSINRPPEELSSEIRKWLSAL